MQVCCTREMPNVVEVQSWAHSGLSPKSSSSAWVGHTAKTAGSPWPGLAGGAQEDKGQWPGAHSVPQESSWTHIQSTATQKTLLLVQIKLAVLNLFQLTTAQLRIPTDRAQEDTKAQLDMVSTNLSLGQWGWGHTGTSTSLAGCGIRLQSSQVLLCMRGLADICATGTHPQHKRGAGLLQGQE